ncbi:MAG: hypothetical protein NZ522_07560, partial [Chitinophagales bacterium]|nr:hypothetical protein [Chitinophagales bacterium]
ILSLYRFIKTFQWMYLPFIIGLFILLFFLKVYVLACFLCAGVGYIAIHRVQHKRNTILIFAATVFIILIAAWLSDHFLLDGLIAGGLEQKQRDMYNLAVYMQSGSIMSIPEIHSGELKSFIYSGLCGLLNTWFMPAKNMGSNPLLWAATAENILLTALFVGMLLRMKSFNHREFKISLICIGYAFLLLAVIGITTPVAGSVIRYRIPALLMLLMPLSSSLNFLKNSTFRKV